MTMRKIPFENVICEMSSICAGLIVFAPDSKVSLNTKMMSYQCRNFHNKCKASPVHIIFIQWNPLYSMVY